MNKEIEEIKERLKKKYMKLYTDYSKQLYSTEAEPEKYYAFDKDQVFIDIRLLLSSLEKAREEIDEFIRNEYRYPTLSEFSNLQDELKKEKEKAEKAEAKVRELDDRIEKLVLFD